MFRDLEIWLNHFEYHAQHPRCVPAGLSDVVEDHDIPRKQTDATDFVFCCLRRLGRFETRLHILVAAELIANVYYRALESATGCQRLKVLCRTLVADELAHIGLESQLLLTLRTRKPAVVRAGARLFHKAFFTCAASAVYLTHR